MRHANDTSASVRSGSNSTVKQQGPVRREGDEEGKERQGKVLRSDVRTHSTDEAHALRATSHTRPRGRQRAGAPHSERSAVEQQE